MHLVLEIPGVALNMFYGPNTQLSQTMITEDALMEGASTKNSRKDG